LFATAAAALGVARCDFIYSSSSSGANSLYLTAARNGKSMIHGTEKDL
jgi:hypothetical protein